MCGLLTASLRGRRKAERSENFMWRLPYSDIIFEEFVIINRFVAVPHIFDWDYRET